MTKVLRPGGTPAADTEPVAGISLAHVTKRFPGFEAVSDVSLEIDQGEFLVLVGPSGCGKTTVLRMIAGLEAVTEGRIRIGGIDVTDFAPKNRDISMVFQDYALYPHLSVERNIGIGLKLRGVGRTQRHNQVSEVASVLGLSTLLERRPSELSGGQRQRVAIGRAMVREPQAFLMDEPLSNLDAKLRIQMRAELGRLRDRLRVTTVYVTHDQVEAMTLGDRVAVLDRGVLQQVGEPQELFDHPTNTFVAGFIGSPEMNLVHAEMTPGRLRFGSHTLDVPEDTGVAQGPVIAGIRPTDFTRATEATSTETARMTVRAEVVESLGFELRILFGVDAPSGAITGTTAGVGAGPAETPLLHDPGAAPNTGTTFTACLGASRLRPGDTVELVFDPAALHYFDPRTGLAIGPRARPLPTDGHET